MHRAGKSNIRLKEDEIYSEESNHKNGRLGTSEINKSQTGGGGPNRGGSHETCPRGYEANTSNNAPRQHIPMPHRRGREGEKPPVLKRKGSTSTRKRRRVKRGSLILRERKQHRGTRLAFRGKASCQKF